MIHCGKGAINSALKARILLKADVSENGPGWSDERIAEALETSLSTVFRTRRQFVEGDYSDTLSVQYIISEQQSRIQQMAQIFYSAKSLLLSRKQRSKEPESC